MKYSKLLLVACALFSFALYSKAQSVSDYADVMKEIGCGNEFSKTISLPVPLSGYGKEAERRISQEHIFNILGQSPPRTTESIRKALLYKPINLVDKMSQEMANSEFSYYLGEKNIAGDSSAVQFEKSVAVTLLCMFEKRRNLKAEDGDVSAKVSSLGDGSCNTYLQKIFSYYPENSPMQDMLTKMIRNGQEPKSQTTSPSQVNFGDYDPSRAAVPQNFKSAVSQWMRARSIKVRDLQEQQRQLPLVPAKEEVEKWKLLQRKHDVSITIANYWVCQRANSEGMLKWFNASPDNVIYLSQFDPWGDDLKVEQFVWRMYKARIEDTNKPSALSLDTLASCYSKKTANIAAQRSTGGQLNAKGPDSKYPDCDRDQNISNLFNDIKNMENAKKTIFIGTSFNSYKPYE